MSTSTGSTKLVLAKANTSLRFPEHIPEAFFTSYERRRRYNS
jgi:hypothetical protein